MLRYTDLHLTHSLTYLLTYLLTFLVDSVVRRLIYLVVTVVRYLEKKRVLFPRFFFLSDGALLTVLGQAADSRQLHAHLSSLFTGVSSLQFDDKHRDVIVSVSSAQGVTLQVLTYLLMHIALTHTCTHST